MNIIIKQHRRAFLNYQQDDWTCWLPMAEFVTNNHSSESTRYSPFFVNYGFHPIMSYGQQPVQNVNDIREVNANTLSETMKKIFEQMKSKMFQAQIIQAEEADKHCQEDIKLKIGDRVWMDARNIAIHRPSKKLKWKHLGQYEIVAVISPWAYR
jgi:hypothetical protein